MGWLKNNLKLNKYMSILIDSDKIECDKDGSYLINVAYSRVSTEKQAEEGLGLEAQRDSIISYCRLNNIKNCVLFTDDGYTGTNLSRPAIQSIIRMIKEYNCGQSNIRINTLIVPRIDRLARSLLDMLQFIEDYILSKDGSKSKTNTNRYDINFDCYDLVPGISLIFDEATLKVHREGDAILTYENEADNLLIHYFIEGQCQLEVGPDKFTFLKNNDINLYVKNLNPYQFNYNGKIKMLHLIINKKQMKEAIRSYHMEYFNIVEN